MCRLFGRIDPFRAGWQQPSKTQNRVDFVWFFLWVCFAATYTTLTVQSYAESMNHPATSSSLAFAFAQTQSPGNFTFYIGTPKGSASPKDCAWHRVDDSLPYPCSANITKNYFSILSLCRVPEKPSYVSFVANSTRCKSAYAWYFETLSADPTRPSASPSRLLPLAEDYRLSTTVDLTFYERHALNGDITYQITSSSSLMSAPYGGADAISFTVSLPNTVIVMREVTPNLFTSVGALLSVVAVAYTVGKKLSRWTMKCVRAHQERELNRAASLFASHSLTGPTSLLSDVRASGDGEGVHYVASSGGVDMTQYSSSDDDAPDAVALDVARSRPLSVVS